MNKLSIEKFSIDKRDWIKVKFGDVAFEPKESAKDPVSEGVEHVVGLEHIDSEDIHLRRSASIEESTTFTKKFAIGDVLFGRRRAYLKKAAQAEFEGICSGDITVMRAKELLLPELLPFVVHNEKFFDYAITHSAGGLSPRVKFKDLVNYEFLLPPKEQQEQLAELLWAMDETIEKESLCLIAAQKLLDRSMDFHFLKGNGKSPVSKFGFYLIPNHWNVLKTSEFASVEYGISKSVASNTDPSIGWQIITGANISLDGKFDLEKKRYIEPPDKERFLLNRGDLLFNWRSGSPEHIGKTAIFDLDGDYTYASFVLRIRCGDKTINRYMFYLFNYLRKIEFFTKNISKQVNFKINATIFREIQFPIPPLGEQQEILTKLELINESIEEILHKVSNSRFLQKSLLNQVF